MALFTPCYACALTLMPAGRDELKLSLGIISDFAVTSTFKTFSFCLLQKHPNVLSIYLHAGTALDVVDFLRGLGIEVSPGPAKSSLGPWS